MSRDFNNERLFFSYISSIFCDICRLIYSMRFLDRMFSKPVPSLQLVVQNKYWSSGASTDDPEGLSLMHGSAMLAERQGHNLEGFQTTQELLVLVSDLI